jgi:dTDP-glucose pyrophosphorylase
MTDWKETILSLDSTVGDAIQNLNDTGARIVLVTDADLNFVGVIVDGDIRRGLLNGVTLTDHVTKIVNRDARTVFPGVSRSNALELMEVWNVSHFPVIDKKGKLCGLHSIVDASINATRTNLFVIMAGGFGKRMGVETTNIPKPMLKVAGKPMLEHLIIRAIKSGFMNFAISIHFQGEVIEKYFGDGSRYGIRITYLREERPLGTAGSLSLLNPLPTESIVVSNADLVSSVDFGALLDFHVIQGGDATMAVRDHEWQNPFGVVEISDGKVIEVKEKPINVSTISVGMYAFNPLVLKEIDFKTECDMPQLFEQLIRKGKVIVPFPVHESWNDVAAREDLDLMNAEYQIGEESF